MAGVIVRDPRELAANLQALLGPGFVAQQRPEVLFVVDVSRHASVARVSHRLAQTLSGLTGLLFVGVTGAALLDWWRDASAAHFRDEGPLITLGMFALCGALLGITSWHLRSVIRRERALASGAVRHGVWLTDTHLIVHDADEGLRAVERAHIDKLELYRSGRPPLDLLLVRTAGNGVIRICVDALEGFRGRAPEFERMLTRRLAQVPMPEVDQLLARTRLPLNAVDWTHFHEFLVAYASRMSFDAAQRSALVDYVDDRITHWDAAGRRAPESWWIDVEREENWEYGRDGVTAREEFKGYLQPAHWLMPLARSAEISVAPVDLRLAAEVKRLAESAVLLRRIERLRLAVPVGDHALRLVMTSEHLGRLRQLELATKHVEDPALLASFAAWLVERRIASA